MDQDQQWPATYQNNTFKKSVLKHATFMLPTAASKHRNIKESIHNKPQSEIDRTLGQPHAKRRVIRKISQERYT